MVEEFLQAYNYKVNELEEEIEQDKRREVIQLVA